VVFPRVNTFRNMSTLTLTSPGVQISETDLSVISRPIGATDILITGFTNYGPTEEFVRISSISEFEDTFGVPTNAAERYLYHTARQILNTSPGNLLVNRLPYGDQAGQGFSNTYSALVYPVTLDTNTTGTSNTQFQNASAYVLGAPTSVLLTDSQFNQLQSGNITWSTTPYALSSTQVGAGAAYATLAAFYTGAGAVSSDVTSVSAISPTLSAVTWYYSSSGSYVTSSITPSTTDSVSALANAGLIVLNTSKRSIDSLFQGYYVGVISNQNVNPSTNFNSLTSIQTAVSNTGIVQSYATVPQSRLNFQLTATYANFGGTSLSQVIEQYPTGFSFASKSYSDSLVIGLFKITTSNYNKDTVSLNYKVAEAYTGSLYANRTIPNPNGGAAKSFSLETVVDNASRNIQVLINPYISKVGNWSNTTLNGVYTPLKTVTVGAAAQSLYPLGVYVSDTDTSAAKVGNIPLKLQNVLNSLQNSDEINLDVTAEAGLGTIWASCASLSASNPNSTIPITYDDTYNYLNSDRNNKTNLYSTSNASGSTGDGAGFYYQAIANQFISLANDTRKDHVFIADPLRHIFVVGANQKTSGLPDYVFSDHIYWPLNNLYSPNISSYVVTYGNWLKYNDTFSNSPVWLPPSGYVAGLIASASQTSFPWSAVAGFSRGTLSNVTDVAVNPTQKQRDLLYKGNINPIAYFPNEGYVVYGQKTLYRTPSAFDRLNVRRLFLTLEKQTQALLKYFVFEPNTFSTRTRLVGALRPIFDNAKINNGLYDYLLVCDERNNTPSVIDSNQLAISIYIQPVKTAEFILCDFIATQTGVNFNEVVGQ